MLLFSETFQAWVYGPVVPSVYYEFSSLGGSPINRVFFENSLDSETVKIINRIIDEYCAKNPWDLVNESHEPGSPWAQVFKKGYTEEIPNELILQA